MDKSIVLGVDIGGSHITAALVNLKTRELLPASAVREFVNSRASASEIIEGWTKVMHQAFQAFPVSCKKLGIAMPGPFDYEEGISLMKNQDKYDALYGLNIKEILAENLQINKSHLHFINDAECFLKGEVFGGAAQGCKSAVGLTLGTGLGSSIYGNGTVADADLWSAPFLDSIAEEYLSTRWFTKRYASLTSTCISNVKELMDMESSGPVRQQIFREFGRNLALFLNRHLQDLQPEVIVLGGNISKAFDLFKGELTSHLAGGFSQTAVHTSRLGEDASLIGAASAWHTMEAEAIKW
jgi:glucokinase